MPVRLERRPLPPEAAPVLDAGQGRVVAHRAGPLRVLGAAGTGRTTALVEAVAARLGEGEDPASILVLVADRRAARDVRARLARRLAAAPGTLPAVTTFHSLAYSLLGAELAQDPDAVLPRLLSGAEEDVRVRELLLGGVADGTVAWPDDLRAALPTLGLANEVRAILARLREADLPPEALERLGEMHGRDAWSSVASFARAEEAVAALENVIDYATLMSIAIVIAARHPQPAGAMRPRFAYVDDAQDATPAQWRLLDALRPAAVVVAGDPDAAVFGFRGAGRGGLLEFAADHPGCETVVLGTLWRHGEAIHAAARRVIGAPARPGAGRDRGRMHLRLVVGPQRPCRGAAAGGAPGRRGALGLHRGRRAHGVPPRSTAPRARRGGRPGARLGRRHAAACRAVGGGAAHGTGGRDLPGGPRPRRGPRRGDGSAGHGRSRGPARLVTGTPPGVAQGAAGPPGALVGVAARGGPHARPRLRRT
ncbi:MAG: UvrD-helicase domain-containing protein [bacterium]